MKTMFAGGKRNGSAGVSPARAGGTPALPAGGTPVVRLAALLICAVALAAASRAHAAADEQALISVLKSEKPPAEKAAACRSLKTAGTAQSVPALAALLADKDLAHWARWALSTMPGPEAGAALREALAKAAGVTKAGICDTLGERKDREAVPALAELAKDADAVIASSAAIALGKIGGEDAVKALKDAKAKAPAGAQLAISDGLLMGADQFLAAGNQAAAKTLYEEMYKSEGPEHVRVAAYRGLVLASGNEALALLTKALTGDERAARRAALQLARQIKDDRAPAKELAALLEKVPPATQAALLEALKQRGDAAAVGGVVPLLGSKAPEVRIAALGALGALGDASAAPVLAEAAAKAAGAEQDAAREALNLLRDPKTRDALLERLPKADAAVQAEIVRALGFRKETQAVPALLKMAQGADDATRLIAIKSLAMLADASAAGDLIKLLLQAKTDAERDALEQALTAACSRSTGETPVLRLVLDAMNGADVPVRVALLRAAAKIGGSGGEGQGGKLALQALQQGLQDKEPAVQDAALRAMSDFGGLDAAPDLLKLAKESQAVPQRVLALRGYLRLVASAVERPLEERWKMCEPALAAAQRPEEKKLGLSELAKIPHPAEKTRADSYVPWGEVLGQRQINHQESACPHPGERQQDHRQVTRGREACPG
ncbi:MAG: HEAT repeat domain-containing protein, partial [Planctomycetota bacterium]